MTPATIPRKQRPVVPERTEDNLFTRESNWEKVSKDVRRLRRACQLKAEDYFRGFTI